MGFNNRLKQLRHKNNLTQRELADALGLKPSTISNYESARNEPSFDKLISLSKHFGVSCDYLLETTDIQFPIKSEMLDKDIIETFKSYKELTPNHAKEVDKYINYLLYKQENSNPTNDSR